MESSRRSFDRSRDLGMKKPRLDESIVKRTTNGRTFIPAPSDGNDSARVGLGAIQELVSQYKTALAELTFNSKPIITNLTIIAGENLNAAKPIAATICSNIIEVPTDQKLPSLYLLDSIVKNIGRDYIKCFAARLPEVFCKAYRQVDPAVHPGMRHLFGTWKGVFPPQCLQMIEKELGFTPAVNGSALGTTTSKPDSHTQRPAHSIHVNPKYIEARQHLQQPSRAKKMSNDISKDFMNSPEDAERLERTINNSSGGQRADPRLRMHNIQRPVRNGISEPVQGKNTVHEEYEYGTEISRQAGSGILKTSDRVADQGYDSPSYGAGSGDRETSSRQRNDINVKGRLLNSSAPRPANNDAKSQPILSILSSRNSSGMESWQNSDEEEYMWDDLNSRSDIQSTTRKSKRDPLLTDDSERLDFQASLLKPQNLHAFESRVDREASHDLLSLEQKEQTAFRNRSTSIWSRESHAVDGMSSNSGQMTSGHLEGHYTSMSGLSTNANSLVRNPLPSPTNIEYSTNALPESSGSVRQQRYTLAVTSPSGQLPMHQRPPSPSLPIPHYGKRGHNLSGQELSLAQSLPHMDTKPSRIPGQLNLGLHRQFPLNPGTPIQSVHPGNSQKLQPHNLQALSSIRPSQEGHHTPFLQQRQPVHTAYDISAASTMEKSSPDHSGLLSSENQRQLITPNLLSSVAENRILGTSSDSGSKRLSFQAPNALPSHSSVRPPLPSGPPPTQSKAKVASGSHVRSPYKITSVSSILPQTQVEQPPLPNGPPPSSLVGGATEQTKIMMNATPDPVSSLLSTLVAKGLISASKTDLSASGPPQIISKPQNQSQATVVVPPVTTSFLNVSSTVAPASSSKELSGTVVAPSVTTAFLKVSPAATPSSSSKELSLSNCDTKNCTTVPVTSLEERKDLIGLEFKPNVIRELHPFVISDLLENLPHHCSICGIRMKIIEQYDRHMEWHTVKNLKVDNSNKASRRWYVRSLDWVADKVSIQETDDILEVPGIALGNNSEQMVPADENQCACVLCGELFEDIYYQKEDKWMFKGAVYLNVSSNGDIGNTGDDASHSLIIHAECISESSIHELGLGSKVIVESDA